MIFRLKRWMPLVAVMCVAGIVSCNTSPKEKQDTPTSGVIRISADETFAPIIQQEIDVFESTYPDAGIVPEYVSEVEAITMLIRDSVRLAVTTRSLTKEEEAALNSKKLFP